MNVLFITLDQFRGDCLSAAGHPVVRTPHLDALADGFSMFDVVGLQECDPGSLRSGFDNQCGYLAERARFPYWSHQANRRISRIAGSGNALLSRIEPTELLDYALPGRIAGRGVLLAKFGAGKAAWQLAITHLSLGARSRQLQLSFLADLLAEAPRLVQAMVSAS